MRRRGPRSKACSRGGSGARIKLFTGTHWVITQADPESGRVIFHHGGTYTVNGDPYAGTVEYANPNTTRLIGRTHEFESEVESDTYIQRGLNNNFNEIWRRLDIRNSGAAS